MSRHQPQRRPRSSVRRLRLQSLPTCISAPSVAEIVRPIDLIVQCASQFESTADRAGSDQATLTVSVTHVDGEREQYELVARDVGGGAIKVCEVRQQRLPAYCPERHINPDSSFCLSWKEDVNLTVSDAVSAEKWWGHLMQFLREQRRAEKTHRWPGVAWAHGPEAAKHQREAENAASRLGTSFASALRAKRMSVVKTRYNSQTNGAVLHVLKNGEVAYSVWARNFKTINKQQACICARGDIKRHRRLRNCATHSEDVDVLAASLLGREKAENAFWGEARKLGKTCCGTIKDCPLRDLGEKHD